MTNDTPNPREGMSLIMKTVSHWVRAFLLVFGIYVVLYGHLTPGGGFPGGVVIGCAFILIVLAEGKSVAQKNLSKSVASELDSVGALIFLGAGIIGLAMTRIFFENVIETPEDAYFNLFSSGLIPICNIGIGLKVGMSLFMVFIILAALRVVPGGGDKAVEKGQS